MLRLVPNKESDSELTLELPLCVTDDKFQDLFLRLISSSIDNFSRTGQRNFSPLYQLMKSLLRIGADDAAKTRSEITAIVDNITFTGMERKISRALLKSSIFAAVQRVTSTFGIHMSK